MMLAPGYWHDTKWVCLPFPSLFLLTQQVTEFSYSAGIWLLQQVPLFWTVQLPVQKSACFSLLDWCLLTDRGMNSNIIAFIGTRNNVIHIQQFSPMICVGSQTMSVVINVVLKDLGKCYGQRWSLINAKSCLTTIYSGTPICALCLLQTHLHSSKL